MSYTGPGLTPAWLDMRRTGTGDPRGVLERFNVLRPPVPIEAMIRALGIQTHVVSDPPYRRWKGGARLDPKAGQVFVSRNLPQAEQRLVLAHELGHMMLGPLGRAYADDVVTLGKPAREDRSKRFAYEVLMPWWLLEPYLSAYAKDEVGLAQLFGVPSHSMSDRVLELIFG